MAKYQSSQRSASRASTERGGSYASVGDPDDEYDDEYGRPLNDLVKAAVVGPANLAAKTAEVALGGVGAADLQKMPPEARLRTYRRHAIPRATYAAFTTVVLLVFFCVVATRTDVDGDAEFGLKRTTYVTIYNEAVPSSIHRNALAGIGLAALLLSAVVTFFAVLYASSDPSMAISLGTCCTKGAQQDGALAKLILAERGASVSLFFMLMALVESLTVFFAAVVSGTNELALLTLLVALSICGYYFQYRAGFYGNTSSKDGVIMGLYLHLRIPAFLFTATPFVVIFVNAYHFYNNVKGNHASDADHFNTTGDYYAVYVVTLVLCCAMWARAILFHLTPALWLKVVWPSRVPNDKDDALTARYVEWWKVNRWGTWLSLLLWSVTALSIPLIAFLDENHMGEGDERAIYLTQTYRVGPPAMGDELCDPWRAVWLILAGCCAVVLHYLLVLGVTASTLVSFKHRLIYESSEAGWIFGHGLMDAVLFFVLSTAAGSSDVMAALLGSSIILILRPLIVQLASSKNDTAYDWERKLSGVFVVLVGLVPYAWAVAKSYMAENTVLDNHASGESIRAMLILYAAVNGLLSLSAIFDTVSNDLKNPKRGKFFDTTEALTFGGVSLIQLLYVWIIVVGKVLSPYSQASKLCLP